MIKTAMNHFKHLKLEQSHFSSDSLILYFLRINQLIKYKVKINAFSVKKWKIRTQKINFCIVHFVDILLAKFVAVNKESLYLLLRQDNHLSSYKGCAAKFVIENFHKNLSRKESRGHLCNRLNHLNQIRS